MRLLSARALTAPTPLRSSRRAVACALAALLAACSSSGRQPTPPPVPRDASTASDATVLDANTPAPDASATDPDAGTPAPDAAAAPDADTPRPDAAPGDAATPAPDATVSPDSGVWRPFANTSPWNTPIPAGAAVDPDNTALIEDFATSSASFPFLSMMIREWTVPVYYVQPGDPLGTVDVTRVGGEGFNPEPVQVPIPAGARPDPRSDAHMSIIDLARGIEYGFFGTAGSGTNWTCRVCATADLRGSGVKPPDVGRADWWLSHGPRACGFPTIAGLIRVDELRAGRIDHALIIAYPHIRSRYYVQPASTSQGRVPGQAEPDRGVPCGGRMQLDPTLDVTTLGLSRSGQIIARALQEYGAYVGDFAGAINLYAEGSDAAQAEYQRGLLATGELRRGIDLRRFRVLQLGQVYDGRN